VRQPERQERKLEQMPMSDQSQSERFKAEMPEIPGVAPATAQAQPLTANPAVRLVGGLLAVLFLFFIGSRFFHTKHTEAVAPPPPAQIEVPTPAADPTPALPRATAANPEIATVTEMAKPWSSKEFLFVDHFSNESTPALLIRLSSGSASQPEGYWALAMKAPYGSCHLEFVSDVAKLKEQYDFNAGRHPMVGDPCSRTVFDPLKMTEIPGNIWVRGSIAQGSDLRPPLGIELKIQGKDIQAIRME
jgi:hypothetical protein